MSEQNRIEEMKEYVSAKGTVSFLGKLSAAFIAVALLATLFGAATGYLYRWMIGLVILWGCAIALLVASMGQINEIKKRRESEAKFWNDEAAADFGGALRIHNDNLRMGKLYIFGRNCGIIPYAGISYAGMRTIPLNNGRLIQYYVVTKSNETHVIYQEDEEKMDELDIKDIKATLAKNQKNILFVN